MYHVSFKQKRTMLSARVRYRLVKGIRSRIRTVFTFPSVVLGGVIAVGLLLLFWEWFTHADRSCLFLYGHMGALPLDERTLGRYRMSGLVAAGAVMDFMLFLYGTWGVFARRRLLPVSAPSALGVWLTAVSPLGLGIPLIVAWGGVPSLPIKVGLEVAGLTLAGLAVGLWLAKGMAWDPTRGLTRLGYGMAITPLLLGLRVVELPGLGLAQPEVAAWMVLAGLLSSGIGLLGLARWRAFWDAPPIRGWEIWLAGAAMAYLELPLLHHIFLTPAEARYITAASNFFAFHGGVQVLVWMISGMVALGIETLERNRRWWEDRDHGLAVGILLGLILIGALAWSSGLRIDLALSAPDLYPDHHGHPGFQIYLPLVLRNW